MDKIKILIVDDERNICFILGTCLENSGYLSRLGCHWRAGH